jgi:hypothetical protein
MGGQAKWRKAEIEELKRQSPEEAAVWRRYGIPEWAMIALRTC